MEAVALECKTPTKNKVQGLLKWKQCDTILSPIKDWTLGRVRLLAVIVDLKCLIRTWNHHIWGTIQVHVSFVMNKVSAIYQHRVWGRQYPDGRVDVSGIHMFQKFRIHFYIVGVRQVTWSRFCTENPKFWSDLWSWLLYVAFCLMNVKWYALQ